MTVLILDTATLYYRAFFALPESMTAPDGFPNNAVRGTVTMLTKLIAQHRTCDVVACWDIDWRPQWRVDLVPEYKTHRTADEGETEPDTLGPQIGALAELLDALGVPRPGRQDYEADDIIASLTASGSDQRIVVTNDRDLVQVINDQRRVRLHMMVAGGMDSWPVLDEAAATARYGVPPDRYVQMAVLRGDPSDGLPGVPGVGAKTAVRLIQAFTTVEQVIAAADTVTPPLTPRIAERIVEHAESLRAAETVATAVSTLRIHAPRWSPKRIRSRTLDTLASEWGVTGPIAGLRAALEAQHDASAQ